MSEAIFDFASQSQQSFPVTRGYVRSFSTVIRTHLNILPQPPCGGWGSLLGCCRGEALRSV